MYINSPRLSGKFIIILKNIARKQWTFNIGTGIIIEKHYCKPSEKLKPSKKVFKMICVCVKAACLQFFWKYILTGFLSKVDSDNIRKTVMVSIQCAWNCPRLNEKVFGVNFQKLHTERSWSFLIYLPLYAFEKAEFRSRSERSLETITVLTRGYYTSSSKKPTVNQPTCLLCKSLVGICGLSKFLPVPSLHLILHFNFTKSIMWFMSIWWWHWGESYHVTR